MKNLQQHILEKLKIDKNTKLKRSYFVPKTLDEFKDYVIEQMNKSPKTRNMYGTKENPVDLSYIDFSLLANENNEALSYFFSGNRNILYLNMSNCKFGNMISLSDMFSDSYFKEINVGNWNLGEVTILSAIFDGCKQLENIYGIETLDMSKIERIGLMFRYCSKIKELDLSSWRLPNAIRVPLLFSECYNLEKVDLTGWDKFSSNFIKCQKMFKNCTNLKTIKGMENWDFSKCNNASNIFYGCKKLNINIDNWKINTELTEIKNPFEETNIQAKWYK